MSRLKSVDFPEFGGPTMATRWVRREMFFGAGGAIVVEPVEQQPLSAIRKPLTECWTADKYASLSLVEERFPNHPLEIREGHRLVLCGQR